MSIANPASSTVTSVASTRGLSRNDGVADSPNSRAFAFNRIPVDWTCINLIETPNPLIRHFWQSAHSERE